MVYGVDLKRVFRSKLVLGIADGWLEADGRRIYEAKDLRVGLFQADAAGGLSGHAWHHPVSGPNAGLMLENDTPPTLLSGVKARRNFL